MHESHDPLEHVWKCLKADTAELAGNPLLEKRLMNEMNKPIARRPFWRKMAIAAGLLLGCLVLSGGIAAAAGYNPFKTLTVFFGNDGKAIITDENGNQISSDAVKLDVQEVNGQKQVTVELKADGNGKVNLQSVAPPK